MNQFTFVDNNGYSSSDCDSQLPPCNPSMLSDTSNSDFTDTSSSEFSILELCQEISKHDETLLLSQNGYKDSNKLCDTLQGELYHATSANGTEVAIKKIDKLLSQKNIAEQDGITFCVDESIEKEIRILKHISENNTSQTSKHVIQYIDSFESEDYFYLVTKYIHGMKLSEFITKAHDYVNKGKLKLSYVQRIMKSIIWQITVTLRSLHCVFRTCHLDLCADNIMVENVNFIQMKENEISIRICDFGANEQFEEQSDFQCYKHALNIDNEAYHSPQIFECDYYDGRSADIWALGMLFYQSMTGQVLYKWNEMGLVPKNGYEALHNGKLESFLSLNKAKYFKNSNSVSFLLRLLNIDEHKRITLIKCLRHRYFSPYFSFL